jgi:xylulokinase
MSICVDSPLAEPRLILGNHVLPGMWLLQGGTVGGGGAVSWFFDQYGESFGGDWSGFDAAAADVPAGSGGVIFLPYLNGERSPIWDTEAKGVFHG